MNRLLTWEGRKQSPWPSAVVASSALNIIREGKYIRAKCQDAISSSSTFHLQPLTTLKDHRANTQGYPRSCPHFYTHPGCAVLNVESGEKGVVSHIRASSIPHPISLYTKQPPVGVHTTKYVVTRAPPPVNSPSLGTALSAQTQRVRRTDLDPNLRGEHGVAASVLLTDLLPASGVRLSPSVSSSAVSFLPAPSPHRKTNCGQTASRAMPASLGRIAYFIRTSALRTMPCLCEGLRPFPRA